MNVEGGTDLSVSKLKLLALLGKASQVIPFASARECDQAFVKLTAFCKRASLSRNVALHASTFAQQTLPSLIAVQIPVSQQADSSALKKQRVCSCDPFAGTCAVQDQDTRSPYHGASGSGLCQCCDGAEREESLPFVSSDDYCAECLCSLARAPYHSQSGEKEFELMISWTALHDDRWSWVPVVSDEFGVFRSVWRWMKEETSLRGENLPSTIEALITRTAKAILARPELSSDERSAWTTIAQDVTRVGEACSSPGFTKHLWCGIMTALPFVVQVSLHHICRSQELSTELCVLEEHRSEQQREGGCHLHLLIWNQDVAPQYDVLIEKSPFRPLE